jgi:hypothetical protein
MHAAERLEILRSERGLGRSPATSITSCAAAFVHDGGTMVKSLILANPRRPGMAEARLPGGTRALARWSMAVLPFLAAAGCGGGSGNPPMGPDGGVDGRDGAIDPSDGGGGGSDAIDPSRPDAGPPQGFDFPTQLTASDGASFNWFGYSVAADDNVIVVGAPFYDLFSGDEVVDPSIGTAYVFERIGDSWQQTAQLFSSATVRTSGMFGWSVAVEGTVIAVGAWNEDLPIDQLGAVYVFERSAGVWTQTSKLLPLTNDGQERFGFSLDISGDVIAVGAPFITDVDDDVPATPAYVFQRSGSGWQGTRLRPTDDPRDAWFGYSVAVSGTVAVVGAPGDKTRGLGTGAAYVFEQSGGNWTQTARLEDAAGSPQDFLGRGVAVDGDVIVIGAEAGGDPSSLNTGIALVFERPQGVWTETARLLPASVAVGSQLGHDVDVRGDTIVVGAHADDQFGTDSGAAFVFKKDTTGWFELSKLYNHVGTAGDYFGASVAVTSSNVIIGARFDDATGQDSGSVNVFTPSP